mgnify:CR=1 FL=1
MNLKIKKILNKKNKTKIICLTSYSKNIAEILDKYTDIILVGDSLGSVLYSFDTTKKVAGMIPIKVASIKLLNFTLNIAGNKQLICHGTPPINRYTSIYRNSDFLNLISSL